MARIRSGRLRHYVEIYSNGGQNDYGEYDPTLRSLVFDARANVKVKSGSQMQDFGSELTNEIITVLMYHDTRAGNDMFLIWNDKEYNISHIKPDEDEQSMIITAERVGK